MPVTAEGAVAPLKIRVWPPTVLLGPHLAGSLPKMLLLMLLAIIAGGNTTSPVSSESRGIGRQLTSLPCLPMLPSISVFTIVHR